MIFIACFQLRLKSRYLQANSRINKNRFKTFPHPHCFSPRRKGTQAHRRKNRWFFCIHCTKFRFWTAGKIRPMPMVRPVRCFYNTYRRWMPPYDLVSGRATTLSLPRRSTKAAALPSLTTKSRPVMARCHCYCRIMARSFLSGTSG